MLRQGRVRFFFFFTKIRGKVIICQQTSAESFRKWRKPRNDKARQLQDRAARVWKRPLPGLVPSKSSPASQPAAFPVQEELKKKKEKNPTK